MIRAARALAISSLPRHQLRHCLVYSSIVSSRRLAMLFFILFITASSLHFTLYSSDDALTATPPACFHYFTPTRQRCRHIYFFATPFHSAMKV